MLMPIWYFIWSCLVLLLFQMTLTLIFFRPNSWKSPLLGCTTPDIPDKFGGSCWYSWRFDDDPYQRSNADTVSNKCPHLRAIRSCVWRRNCRDSSYRKFRHCWLRRLHAKALTLICFRFRKSARFQQNESKPKAELIQFFLWENIMHKFTAAWPLCFTPPSKVFFL